MKIDGVYYAKYNHSLSFLVFIIPTAMRIVDPTSLSLSKTFNADIHANMLAICAPLADLEVNSFFYSCFSETKRTNILSNNFQWLEHLQKILHRYPVRFENLFHFRPGFSIDFLNYFTQNKITEEMIENNMKNAIYLSNVSRDRKSSEIFVFTTADSPAKSQQKLLNHINFFNQFCFEFKDKAHHIIKKTKLDELDLKKCAKAEMPSNSANIIQGDIKRYYLGAPHYDVYLTRKEFLYLKKYISGESAKDVADEYRLSSRTIEKTLENIKKKLACRNKAQLLETINSSQLFYQIYCI